MVTAEQAAEIIRRYQAGKLITAIALSFSIDPEAVYRILYKARVPLRKSNSKGAPRRFTPAQEEQIAKRAEDGEKGYRIAADLGCAAKTIYAILSRHGVEVQHISISRSFTLEQQQTMCDRYVRDGLSLEAVGREFGLSRFGIYTLLRERGIARRPRDEAGRLYACNHSFFDSIDSEHKAYWLGFIAADGNVWRNKVQITLARKDREHLNRFKRNIDSEHPIDDGVSTKRGARSTPNSRLAIKSAQLVAGLSTQGILPRKSLTLCWPKKLPRPLEQHFLRGYFDGDGCFCLNRGQLRMSLVGTQAFCRAAQDLLVENVGLNKTKISAPRHAPNAYYLTYGGNRQVPRIAEFLYRDATVWLPRKRAVIERSAH
jgi:transposase